MAPEVDPLGKGGRARWLFFVTGGIALLVFWTLLVVFLSTGRAAVIIVGIALYACWVMYAILLTRSRKNRP